MIQTSKITLLTRLISLTATVTLPLGLLPLGMPQFAAIAGDWNQFDVCISELKKHGVDADRAATTCSDALIPKELSQCVRMISNATPILGNNALQACYQVRRPIDLGNCVADIYNEMPGLSSSSTEEETEEVSWQDSPLNSLLQSCRASLRPGFYSECVVAVKRNVPDIKPVNALDQCLAAEDFPRDVFPSDEQQSPFQRP